MDYSAVRRAAIQEFDEKLEATGLNTWPCRGGYTISGWRNEGRDIKQVLEDAGIAYDRNLSGIFVVSSWPVEQAAIRKAYDAQALKASGTAPAI